MFSDMPYTYDDYDESDVCEALKVVEEDIRIIDELINGDIKIKFNSYYSLLLVLKINNF